MPEYVYALHDFLPEHEDEVSFHAGERIEVIEKDDMYSDGWWQGRNLAGKIGLFPQSYTAPVPSADTVLPSSSTSSSTTELAPSDAAPKPFLQALHEEESEFESPPILSPTPQTQTQAPAGHETDTDSSAATTHRRTVSSGDEVMKATMTDVQHAIEQLGRARPDGEARSNFSFASSTHTHTDGDADTDTDFDMSDIDRPEVGESWHKGARTKLAEKARRAVAEAEKLEAMMMSGGGGGGGANRDWDRRPPIEVEMSDESEGEEEYMGHGHSGVVLREREHPYILEEDEDVETDGDRAGSPPGVQHMKELGSEGNTVKRASGGADSTHVLLPERDESEAQTATATRMSFPIFQPPTVTTTDAPAQEPDPPVLINLPEPKRNSNNAVYRESLIALPSPTGSFYGMLPQAASKHNSVGSAPTVSASAMSQPPLTQTTLVEEQAKVVEEQAKEKEKEKKELNLKVIPAEWSVEDVVDWLKSKGFDSDVCDKFTEQEITGDVLLELDVTLLKTELGIPAFGKRMRIANAITDLRRPPSIIYSDHHPSPSLSLAPHSPLSQSQSHSRHQSLTSHSHHSYPGTYGYGNGNGGAGGAGESGGEYQGFGGGYNVHQGQQGQGQGQDRLMMPESEGLGMSVSAPAMNGKGSKDRPAYLMLSPSDGALKESAKAVSDVAEEEEEEEEDRGVASEGEATHTKSMRRRLFGRSHESSSSKVDSSANSRHSKEGSVIASPTIPEKVKDKNREKDKDKDALSVRHARSKKSLDGGKSSGGGGERLSIFGGTFTGTLGGKSRKPPPKYPNASEEASTTEKGSGSGSMFSRLGSGGSSRKASAGSHLSLSPSMLNGTPKHVKEPKAGKGIDTTSPVLVAKETPRDPTLLRKRTTSAPAPPTDANRNSAGVVGGAVIAIGSPIKQGQSILEQIGESDHRGWMRKKGDRYNSWKLRYFVLKGAHLYCLRSNSNSETKIKGYINIVGYKVTVDENVNPGRYGFRIEHDNDRTHYFSSDEKTAIRDWMKAIMKATIGRDYTKPVISSCNIPTIPLMVAQAMNPAPRPPSPTARDATQKALRRENTNQLSSRDARILMGLPSSNESKEERTRLESFFSNEVVAPDGEGMNGNGSAMSTPRASAPAPARPSREMRRQSASRASFSNSAEDKALIEWANSHLPMSLQIRDPTSSLCGGLALLRIAESIKGRPTSPPVPDSAFPQGPTDDKLDGLFQLFDFLLENEVKMGSVSINDVRQGKRDKIVQLLRALRAWEEKRRAVAMSLGSAGSVQAGGFMAAPMNLVW
ncbi:hypothetical protein FPV67DRAFT_1715490 [Lyophyllum atratum]|nr:hypothetical protein FPV67DRAFT_1715490 [Lyophyllum atratum]